jgi:UDP-N-acetylglucosamine 1-carboxyvinyltransferase
MDKIIIRGGKPLKGTVDISGAKNACLPIMAACLLSDQPLTLTNVPHLSDIAGMSHLLSQHGVDISFQTPAKGEHPQVIKFHAPYIKSDVAPYEIVCQMRASYYVLGPLLARHGHAKVSMPGGCAIGARPMDLHLMGLEALGATIEIEEGYVIASAPKDGLKGAEISFPLVSVGATAQVMMAATLAKGTTQIINAAQEPDIADLAICLNEMGAKITGAGTARITIEGVAKLKEATHRIIPDRIETGTYMAAAAITRGELTLTNTSIDLLPSFVQKMREAGVVVEAVPNGIYINATGIDLQAVDIITEPFPGFPTDLQAQFLTLMTQATGAAMVTETIFENRFMHVPELARLGADVKIKGRSAVVRGKTPLNGAIVMATDLRASVSLVLAGLVAEGETEVLRVYHLDRGYERLEEKLANVGADIRRVAA